MLAVERIIAETLADAVSNDAPLHCPASELSNARFILDALRDSGYRVIET